MTQASLWQTYSISPAYAELCNALYERELAQLAQAELMTKQTIQSRLKSLPYYIKRTSDAMLRAKTPLILDIQNASWSCKQTTKMPLQQQSIAQVWQWYQHHKIPLGLVIAVNIGDRIVLDSIDRIDSQKQCIRSNTFGWFDQKHVEKYLPTATNRDIEHKIQLLKPTKKVMMAACAGHRWNNNMKASPQPLALRDLLLSCAINWTNFKKLSCSS
jgi:hypothetical protein